MAALIIAWLTFTKTFYAEPTEEKENFLALFLATQKLSKEVSNIMTEYAIKRNALDIELYQGITYKSYIEGLKESQETNLSDNLYQKVKTSKYTKSTIATMQKSLEAQFEDLQKMKTTFTLASR